MVGTLPKDLVTFDLRYVIDVYFVYTQKLFNRWTLHLCNQRKKKPRNINWKKLYFAFIVCIKIGVKKKRGERKKKKIFEMKQTHKINWIYPEGKASFTQIVHTVLGALIVCILFSLFGVASSKRKKKFLVMFKYFLQYRVEFYFFFYMFFKEHRHSKRYITIVHG